MSNSALFMVDKAPVSVNAPQYQALSGRARRQDYVARFESLARVRHRGSNSGGFSERNAHSFWQRLHPINYHKIA